MENVTSTNTQHGHDPLSLTEIGDKPPRTNHKLLRMVPERGPPQRYAGVLYTPSVDAGSASHTDIPCPSTPHRTEPTADPAGAVPSHSGPVFPTAAVYEGRYVVATEARVEAVEPGLLCLDVPAARWIGVGYCRAIVIAAGR